MALAATQQAQVQIEDFYCNVCFELLVDPVVGNCGHDFCKRCLVRWHTQQQRARLYSSRVTCPVCRRVFARGAIADLSVCIRLRDTIASLFPEQLATRSAEVQQEQEDAAAAARAAATAAGGAGAGAGAGRAAGLQLADSYGHSDDTDDDPGVLGAFQRNLRRRLTTLAATPPPPAAPPLTDLPLFRLLALGGPPPPAPAAAAAAAAGSGVGAGMPFGFAGGLGFGEAAAQPAGAGGFGSIVPPPPASAWPPPPPGLLPAWPPAFTPPAGAGYGFGLSTGMPAAATQHPAAAGPDNQGIWAAGPASFGGLGVPFGADTPPSLQQPAQQWGAPPSQGFGAAQLGAELQQQLEWQRQELARLDRQVQALSHPAVLDLPRPAAAAAAVGGLVFLRPEGSSGMQPPPAPAAFEAGYPDASAFGAQLGRPQLSEPPFGAFAAPAAQGWAHAFSTPPAAAPPAATWQAPQPPAQPVFTMGWYHPSAPSNSSKRRRANLRFQRPRRR